MAEVHEGGCLCGAVRYRVRNKPVRTGVLPGARAVAGGTLDDPKWLKIERHAWMRSAHPWFKPPEGVEVFQKASLQQPKKIG